jgi:ABC-2 type transport system ATP-binding protein
MQAISPEKIVEITDVTLLYKDVIALDKVSIEVGKGEMVGLLGPNGAGKTTLMEIIEGVKVPDKGHVTVLQNSSGRVKRPKNAYIGLVLQRFALPKLTTVRELIELRNTGESEPDPSDLIDKLGIQPLGRRMVRELSVGQQQRLCILLALLGNREFLLLDEPTSALDVRSRRAVWNTINEQRHHRNIAGIIATHDMNEASELCDRIYFIDSGVIRSSQKLEELSLKDTPDVFTLRFRSPSEVKDQLKTDLELSDSNMSQEDNDWHELLCPIEKITPALTFLTKTEKELHYISQATLTRIPLESVYLSLIKT